MKPSLPLEEIAALRDKYREMLAMRIEHHAGTEDVSRVRRRMAALATRYPGALREIDRLELDEIRRRIARLDQALSGELEPQPWMIAMALFHRSLRGALAAKRWLASRPQALRSGDADLQGAFRSATVDWPQGDEAREWSTDLIRLEAPPHGRVTALVYERLEKALGPSAATLKQWVFGLRLAPDSSPGPEQ